MKGTVEGQKADIRFNQCPRGEHGGLETPDVTADINFVARVNRQDMTTKSSLVPSDEEQKGVTFEWY